MIIGKVSNQSALEHHGRLINDHEKASHYHAVARDLASEARARDPKFTDKEKINIEIYAEFQSDQAVRETCLELARGGPNQNREPTVSKAR